MPYGGLADVGDAPLAEPGSEFALEFDADFEVPRGFVMAPLADDDPIVGPAIAEARKFAADMGMDQAGFSKMLGMYARVQASEHQALQDAARVQMKSLGANGTARVDAITRQMTAMLGQNHAKALLGTLFTKTQVEAYEKLLGAAASRGAIPSPRSVGGVGGGHGDVRDIAVGSRPMSEIWGATLPPSSNSGGRRRR
ncbi:MAG: hypothetical protein ACREDO_00210 [Methyloceanibacter sp.]